jgi:predicted N-acetyltransferase YhbS
MEAPKIFPPNSSKIRPARASDAPAVASLLRELGYRTSREQARRRLTEARAGATHVLVAEEGKSVVGLLAAQRAPYFPNGSVLLRITALVITSSHRSTGVGEALVRAAARQAARAGCAGLEVTTSVRRRAAHRFYGRLGFSRTSYRFFRRLP